MGGGQELIRRKVCIKGLWKKVKRDLRGVERSNIKRIYKSKILDKLRERDDMLRQIVNGLYNYRV